MRSLCRFAFAIAIYSLAGCAAQAPALPKPVICKGVATLPNGEPLRNVRLVFNPTGVDIEGRADTDSKGQFEVSCYGKGDGLVPGTYIVTVSAADFNNPSPVKNKAMAAATPKKYSESSTSDIKLDITAETTDLKIQLKPN